MLELREVAGEAVPSRREEAVVRAVARRVRNAYDDPGQARSAVEDTLDRPGADVRFYDILEERAPVGSLVWRLHRGQAEVVDIVLEPPQRAPELLPELLDLARSSGASSLAAAAAPGEPAQVALVTAADFVPRATNMVLPLDGAIGDPGGLELRPMTEEEFDDYLQGSVESYVGELAAAGMTPEAAREQGERQMAELIPDGLESPGQSFFTAWVGDTAVGTLWISTERPMAFVYDIAVDEAQRRRGYGEAIMNAGARWSRGRGHPALGLNVFAHNPGARALYDKLGYRVTQDYRTVDLPRDD